MMKRLGACITIVAVSLAAAPLAELRAQSIPVPAAHSAAAVVAARQTIPFSEAIPPASHQGDLQLAHRRSSNWKGAILIGAAAGVAFGAAVASQSGDEGSDRSTGDRLKSGLLAGAMIAVPVTVIVAMLTGD